MKEFIIIVKNAGESEIDRKVVSAKDENEALINYLRDGNTVYVGDSIKIEEGEGED